MVRSSIPTNATSPAVALSEVHFRVGVAWSVARARAKSTSWTPRPKASAVPPFSPTKALAPEAPSVIRSTLTSLPSESFRASVVFWKANPPDTWKKPKRSISRLAEALRSAPLLPSMVSVMLESGPVSISRF